MQIKQWEDKNLAQFSYGIVSDCEKKIVLIDPARNPQQYLDFAKENNAEIIGYYRNTSSCRFYQQSFRITSK